MLSVEWKFKNIDSVVVPPTDTWIDLGQVTSLCNTTDSFLVKMSNEISLPTVNYPLFPPNNGVTVSLILLHVCLLECP